MTIVLSKYFQFVMLAYFLFHLKECSFVFILRSVLVARGGGEGRLSKGNKRDAKFNSGINFTATEVKFSIKSFDK